ncbi:MAG: Holliday junction resolvase RuvX, partial [Pseudomonadota bacterium]
MPLCNMAELAAARSPKGRIMGLDLGTKTIGLAVSDAALMIASPITTIARTGFEADLRLLRQEMDGRDIEALVLGLPINMDGSEGPRAEATRKFTGQTVGEF